MSDGAKRCQRLHETPLDFHSARLLAKEVGVNVDETTLTNALRCFWRFVGHGGVPYGDHRAEGGAGSNGKDAMIAVAMQVAMGTKGNSGVAEGHDRQALSQLDQIDRAAVDEDFSRSERP